MERKTWVAEDDDRAFGERLVVGGRAGSSVLGSRTGVSVKPKKATKQE